MTRTTSDQRLRSSFANIVDQSPGQRYQAKVFKLIAVEDDTYLLMLQGSRCTVFTIFAHSAPSLVPANEQQCSVFEYLCRHQLPRDGVKEFRFSVDLNKHLSQGARNFALRVSTKFNLGAASAIYQSLGGQ